MVEGNPNTLSTSIKPFQVTKIRFYVFRRL